MFMNYHKVGRHGSTAVSALALQQVSPGFDSLTRWGLSVRSACSAISSLWFRFKIQWNYV